MASLMCLESSVLEALQLAAAIDQARERLKLRRPPWEEARWQAHWAALRPGFSDAQLGQALQQGREWEVDEAVLVSLQAQSLVTIRS